MAGRAEPAGLAGEGHPELAPAGLAAHPGEVALLDAAVEEDDQAALDRGAPEAVAPGEALVVDLLEGLVMRLGQPVQGRVARAARARCRLKSGSLLGDPDQAGDLLPLEHQRPPCAVLSGSAHALAQGQQQARHA